MTYLYLDIETVPDDSRKELWGLPDPIALPDPSKFVQGNANDVAGWLKENALAIASENWLPAIRNEELGGKARSTVLNAINAAEGAEATLIKELSLDPERCRAVALGLAIADHIPLALIVTESDNEYNEWDLLQIFWDSIPKNPTIVGYNILGFDLPAICARSILLGTKPTMQIDWRKYGNTQIIDLMLARFPYGKYKSLKDLARQYGIKAPMPDVDGSMVHQMTPEERAEYVKSDVIVTRELHRKFAGFFCPPMAQQEETPF